MKTAVFCSAAALLLCTGLQAQDPAALITQARNGYNQIKNNLSKAAEKMPEDAYSFKPTPEMRTWAALMAHIVDAQARFCGMANGHQVEAPAGSKTAKAEIVAAMKTSFDECDAAFEKLSPENYLEQVGGGRGAAPRLAALMRVLAHDNEEYGYASVYMRLKGVVPPSSDRSR